MAYFPVDMGNKQKVIDTCSPGGNWINEKRYNRQRPAGYTSRKVLCGNWYEERELENDLLEMEQSRRLSRCGGTASLGAPEIASVAHGGASAAAWQTSSASHDPCSSASHTSATVGTVCPMASLDIIQDNGYGRYKGGFNSTPYIMRNVRTAQGDTSGIASVTTYGQDYTSRTSDVRALAKPKLGVRSQVLLQKFLRTAMTNLAEQQEQRACEAVQRSAKRCMADIRGCSDIDGTHMASVYAATMGSGQKERKVIHEIRSDYLCDKPITVYTGNPCTGKTTMVHESRTEAALGSSRFGRHTHFTDSRYAPWGP